MIEITDIITIWIIALTFLIVVAIGVARGRLKQWDDYLKKMATSKNREYDDSPALVVYSVKVSASEGALHEHTFQANGKSLEDSIEGIRKLKELAMDQESRNSEESRRYLG